ncbi:MAG: YkgJ family cysteine cluster protein [Thermoplasmata archaeon]|nr:YkgJ family cysteine cluster protein [Thermoplasmata archaeon]
MGTPVPPIDESLLRGFAFTCRPECGLCCYATPAVDVDERRRLLTLDAATPFETEDGAWDQIGARPDGGACHFLTDAKCRAYGLRPFPCRTYPIHVHVGTRPQATLVLACPGLSLAPLDAWSARPAAGPPRGLEVELAAARTEYLSVPVNSWIDEGRRSERMLLKRLARRGGAIEPELVRDSLRNSPLAIDLEGGVRLPPPGPETPISELPLFEDERLGIVVLRGNEEDEYELLKVRETGGAPESLGQFPAIEPVPSLDPAALRRLTGYLAYLLDRDAFLWSTYQELRTGAPEPLAAGLASLRDATANEVVVRASVRARLRGGDGIRLTVEDLDRGIRAMDGDLLDRPTMGRVL